MHHRKMCSDEQVLIKIIAEVTMSHIRSRVSVVLDDEALRTDRKRCIPEATQPLRP